MVKKKEEKAAPKVQESTPKKEETTKKKETPKKEVTPKKETPKKEETPKIEKEDVQCKKVACSDFRLDMHSTQFGMCVCGFPRQDHKTKNSTKKSSVKKKKKTPLKKKKKEEEVTPKKKETPKKETPKKETPKKETPKKETPKKETPKKETPKKEETPKKKEDAQCKKVACSDFRLDMHSTQFGMCVWGFPRQDHKTKNSAKKSSVKKKKKPRAATAMDPLSDDLPRHRADSVTTQSSSHDVEEGGDLEKPVISTGSGTVISAPERRLSAHDGTAHDDIPDLGQRPRVASVKNLLASETAALPSSSDIVSDHLEKERLEKERLEKERLEKAEAEAQRLREEKEKKDAEAQRLREEKEKAEAEARRLREEKEKKEEEARRLREEKEKKEEEARRLRAEKEKAEAEAQRLRQEKDADRQEEKTTLRRVSSAALKEQMTKALHSNDFETVTEINKELMRRKNLKTKST